MKKKLPHLATDEEAEDFLTKADLSEFDLSSGEMIQLEFEQNSETVSLKLPTALVEAVRSRASHDGVPYERFIRTALEHALEDAPAPR